MRVNRGPGVRHRRLHGRHEDVRRARVRVLRGRQADLRGAHAQRLHAGRPASSCSRSSSGLEIKDCPFANLPEAKSGRWGPGLTAAKMNDCRWLKPVLVAQIEFLEWTGENHLRHTKFIGLRDDKAAKDVRRE